MLCGTGVLIMSRQLLVLCVCVIVALLTYELPFIFGKQVTINETIQSSSETDELSLQIDTLLKKGTLNESEYNKLIELTERKARKRELEWGKEIDLFEPDVYKKFRESSIAWLIFVWVVFLSFIPKSILEFFEAIFLPVMLALFGGILFIEIVIIFSLSFFIYLIKSQEKK